jgi:hypothetical protein
VHVMTVNYIFYNLKNSWIFGIISINELINFIILQSIVRLWSSASIRCWTLQFRRKYDILPSNLSRNLIRLGPTINQHHVEVIPTTVKNSWCEARYQHRHNKGPERAPLPCLKSSNHFKPPPPISFPELLFGYLW